MLKKIAILSICVLLMTNLSFIHISKASVNNSGIMRVNLASMGAPSSINIIVQGNYSVAERQDIHIDRKEYRVSIENSQLVLSDGSTRHVLGNSFTLRQHNGDEPNHLRVNNASYGWVNYRGDMRFLIRNGAIALVNHIFIETYLYGVVPSEMPNSWPIEALKSQAVTARTYALRSQNANRDSFADLCDTQMSQVYRGFNPALTNSIQAVDQTAGLVLMHGGSLAATFYSSSNGGVTEASSNVWLGRGNIPYSTVMQDPFDARNTLNRHAFWTVEIPKTSVPVDVNTGFATEIATLIASQGYSSNLSDIMVREIRDITLSPTNASGRVSLAHITVLLEVVRQSDRTRETIERTFVFERSGVRRALALRSLLFTMQDAGDRYIFSGRGFGHGVGMSQFGAQQKALENHTFEQILAFYFPGTQLVTSAMIPPQLTDMPSRGSERGPQPEQPKEQPQPVNPKPEVQRRTAIVTASGLNVRVQKAANSRRLGTLSRGTRINVIGDMGEWAFIEHGTLKGYVLSVHLRLSDVLGTATVTASRVNVRSGPGTNHSRLGSILRNAKVELLEKSGTWYRIRTAAITGFVDGRFLRVSLASRGATTSLRTATVDAAILNIRSGPGTSHRITGRLKRGARVTIISSSNGWYRIRFGNIQGYVLSEHLKMTQ
jgi:SpoIID/LytB domain protein